MAQVRTDKVQVEVEINGKKAGFTLDELNKTSRQLRRELNKLPADTQEFADKAKQLQAVDAKMKDIKDQVRGVNEEVKKGSGMMDFFKSSLTAISPAMLAAFAIGVVTSFFSTLKDGVGEMIKLRSEVEKLVGSNEELISSTSERVAAISRTFGKSSEEILVAANSVSKNLDITLGQTFDLMEKGFIAGADLSGEFVSNLKEYPAQFKAAGLSAEEAFALITQSVEGGVFGDKGVDLVKEFTLRIREQTTSTRDAMVNAFGAGFSDTVFAGINDGSMTAIEALKLISSEMDSTQIPAKDLQTVVADVFGGPGEDAGLDYIKGLKDVKTSMDNLIDTSSKLTGYQIDLLDAQKDLAAAENDLAAATEGTGNGFKVVGIQIRTFFTEVIAKFATVAGPIFLEWFKSATNAFSELFTNLKPLWTAVASLFGEFEKGEEKSKLLTLALDVATGPIILMVKWTNLLIDGFKYLVAGIQAIGDIAPRVFTSFKDIALESLGGVADIIVGIFTFDVDAIKAGFSRATTTAGKVLDEFTNQVQTNYEKLKADPDPVKESLDAVATVVTDGGNKINQITADQAKEREALEKKAADARLKAEMALEDLRIQLIQDQFNREIETLKTNAARKVAALVGDPDQIIAQTELINQLLDQQIASVEAKRAEADQKAEEERLKKRDSDIETQLEEFEQDEEMQRLLIEDKFSRVSNAEAEHEAALYELRKNALEARLQLLVANGKEESKEAKKLQNQLLKNEVDHNKARVENIQKTEDLKRAIQTETMNVVKDIFAFGIELLGRDEAARKKNAGLLKAFAIFKIGIDLQQEIAGYMAHPANTASFGVAGAFKVALALARAGKAVVDITSKQYKNGVLIHPRHMVRNLGRMATGGIHPMGGIPQGASHDNGGIDLIERNSGRHLGNMEGGEPMLILSQNTYRNNGPIIDRLLDASLYRGGAPIMEDGGVVNAVPASTNDGGQALILDALNGMRQDLNAFSGRLRAVVAFTDIEEAGKTLTTIREESRF